jgi:hypothetical protein
VLSSASTPKPSRRPRATPDDFVFNRHHQEFDMKIIMTAIALAIAAPALAQTDAHQGHGQNQGHGPAQHGQHQPGEHQNHRQGCCADRDGNGRMDCCEQAQDGERRSCCDAERPARR